MAKKRPEEAKEAVKYPHMEWINGEFVPQRPAPSPLITVQATVMEAAHTKLGVKWEGSRKGAFKQRTTKGLADSGCQTCTAGVDFLSEVGCPLSYLVPTSHRINGITHTGLNILGSVMIRFEIGDKETRQMVHISENTRGLYLSETALKKLGVIHGDFPDQCGECECGCATCEGIESVCFSLAGCSCVDDGASECLERTPTPERPDHIPFEPTEENVQKLEEWLLDAFKSSAFNTCSHAPLQSMEGVPMKAVRKKDGVNHPAVYTPIPVAFHWKKKVKADLDRDVRLGIIEKVPQGEVSEWCSRMVITRKANGKPRRTIDFQELNRSTLREIHHTPSPINLVAQIPAGKIKTVMDAWNGYHSLMLDEESRELTTFITEWGRYRYLRGPQGFHGTGDAYTRRFDDITSGEERYLRCVDDGLLWDDSIEDAFWHTFDHVKLCADNGIVFNPEKFRFGRETIEFAGFEVTKDGYRPANHIIDDIKNFPVPRSTTDVRSWFGLVQHVAYSFSETSVMEPLRDLQSKKKPFYWDDNLTAAFQKSKEEIVRLICEGVKAYDLSKHTCLATDWCKEGVGFSLMQKHCKCSGLPDPNCGKGHWRLVYAGSKRTNGSQKRYSPTEGECFAAAYGLNRCRMYTAGCPNLLLATDHNPLTGILNDRRLDSIDNPRLLKLKEKTLGFDFRIVYVKGGSNAIKTADALSRHAVNEGKDIDEWSSIENVAKAHAIHQASGINSVTWDRIKESASVDTDCVSLTNLISEGFPDEKSLLPPELQRFWGMRSELYVIDNVPFKNRKMLIPRSLRSAVLEGLHAGHQGVTGMLSNARERFFWPGMDSEVKQLREKCRQCNEQAPSQSKEPPVIQPPPETPFEQTVADLFHLEGHVFLAYADRFSGWLEVDKLRNATSREVRKSFLRWFRTYGVPEQLATDGGPPFKSYEYRTFLHTWGVERRLSSAYFPQSNGRAEAAVKSAKRILLGNIDPTTGSLNTDAAARALMSHRNTPTQDVGVSPAVMLFGHPLRDHLPAKSRTLRPEWGMIADAREMALAKRVLKTPKSDMNKKQLQPLSLGDYVQVQNQSGPHPTKWGNTGVVSEVLPNRQYNIVVDGSRRITLRNRRFLRKIDPVSRKSQVFPEQDVTTPSVDHERPIDAPLHEREDVVVDEDHQVPESTPTGDIEVSPSPLPLSNENVRMTPRRDTPSNLPEHTTPVRRGTRVRTQVKPFSAKLHGKTHDE